ncbi:hypothetical protein M0R45_006081 [Rubus argutus]|uniref:Uncharacterized protein n=1 Tax=Rubus argutus TaxID=59490 RepID=A0AAW1YPE3_RUBAR
MDQQTAMDIESSKTPDIDEECRTIFTKAIRPVTLKVNVMLGVRDNLLPNLDIRVWKLRSLCRQSFYQVLLVQFVVILFSSPMLLAYSSSMSPSSSTFVMEVEANVSRR